MGNTLESITLCDREWTMTNIVFVLHHTGTREYYCFFFLSKCAAILLASLDPERFHHISLGHNRNCMFPQNVILLICDATRQLTNKSYLIDDWTILRPCKMRTNWRSNIFDVIPKWWQASESAKIKQQPLRSRWLIRAIGIRNAYRESRGVFRIIAFCAVNERSN